MKRRRANPQTLALAGIIQACLALAFLTGCSRQVTPVSNNPANRGQLPFERVSDNSGLSPTAGLIADDIPAGTQFTIRLQTALSSADAHAGDSFQAILDEPLAVAGKTIVPQGTAVAGNVVTARASESGSGAGYLRLTLASIVMRGHSVPLRTSTLFASRSYEKRKAMTIASSRASDKNPVPQLTVGEGNAISINPGQGDIRFSTGHRLSFRLAQPLQLSR
jgi:hypothetical protein